eukprot:1640356-Rhodomonas_salina.1
MGEEGEEGGEDDGGAWGEGGEDRGGKKQEGGGGEREGPLTCLATLSSNVLTIIWSTRENVCEYRTSRSRRVAPTHEDQAWRRRIISHRPARPDAIHESWVLHRLIRPQTV